MTNEPMAGAEFCKGTGVSPIGAVPIAFSTGRPRWSRRLWLIKIHEQPSICPELLMTYLPMMHKPDEPSPQTLVNCLEQRARQ